MKYQLISLLFVVVFSCNSFSKNYKPNKSSFTIGAIYTSPIKFNKKLYFVSADGVLFESDLQGNNAKALFKTMKKSISGIVESNGILYFGEGLHFDEITYFHAFDPVKNKLLFKYKVNGHIEKTPVIYKNMIIFSAGKGGLIALEKETGDLIWETKKMNISQKLHIDAIPIIHKGTIYVAAIYDNKGLLCLDLETGKVTCFIKTKFDIKTDLVFKYPRLVGLGTSASFAEKDRLKPSILYSFNIKSKKIEKEHKLRGHNYFFNYLNIKTGYMFFGMSSGDVLRIHIENHDLKYLDVLPEVFKSTGFKYAGNDCLISTRGVFVCYDKNHKRIKTSKNFVRTSVGTNSRINKFIYLPTRFGYLTLKN